MRRFLPALALTLSLVVPAAAQSFGPWRALGRFELDAAKLTVAEVLAPERQAKGASSLFDSPDFAATFRGMAGEQVTWRTLGEAFSADALDCGEMDLNALVPPPAGRTTDNAAVYLHRSIESPSAMDLAVWVGADDSLRLWLNGRLLVDANVMRGLVVQDHFVKLPLRAGANQLVAKVVNGDGGYRFHIKPWTLVPQEAINAAIDRGCDFLTRHQLIDGSWGAWEEWGGGHAAFCAYTLLKCGVPRSHPAVQKAMAFVRQRPLDTVYAVSCAILAIDAHGEAADREWLEELAARLVGMQSSIGLFDYPIYPDGHRAPIDMSNTLYAALALRAAAHSGYEAPDNVWSRMASGALRCMESPQDVVGPDGQKRRIAGFSYRLQEKVFGSTTTAGLSVLAICEELGGRALTGALKSKMAAAKEHGLAWIAHNMMWSVNPHHGNSHHYFWVYGLERVGGLYKLERLGDVDWYWDGAAYLLKAQAGNGSWNAHGYAYHEYLDTCLALLFLKKATAAPVSGGAPVRVNVRETAVGDGLVRLRATGETPLTIWISGLEDALVEQAATGGVLDVERIDYFARLEGEANEPTLIGSVKGASCKRAELQRFALRHTFERRGKWRISARLHLRRPADKAAAADGAGPQVLEFVSPELAVDVELGGGAVKLDYVDDLEQNLLFDARGKFEASSIHGDGEKPERVCDGSFERRWRCKADDPTPWIRVVLDRPIKADRLLLTHALPRPQHSDSARVSRAELVINQKERFDVALSPDVLEKTVVEFRQLMLVREIEVRVLECRDRKPAGDPVGFAEIELQRPR